MEAVKKFFEGWKKFEIAWLCIAVAVMTAISVVSGDSFIALVSGITGIVGVVLAAKGRPVAFIFAVVHAAAFAYLAWQNSLFGTFMINILYYIPMNCLGFYMWSKNKNGKTGDAKARSLTKKQLGLLFVAVCVAVFLYSQLLTFLGGQLAVLDAVATVFVFTAILMQVSRYAEMWLMFIFSNAANLVVWAALLGTDPSAPTMVAMWACYILNACFGFYNWRKLAKGQQTVESPALEAEFEGAID